MKTIIDNFLLNLGERSVYFMQTLFGFLAAITFSEVIVYGKGLVTFIITLIVGALTIRHYILKNRLKQKEIEKIDQEIYSKAMENKKKFG